MPPTSPRRYPEILAPVGDWDMLRAAVHNGADAVYMGMPGFNARGRAPTLELGELKAMIDYAHLYGVRVLLAFNILIFERELNEALLALKEVLPLAPDAFIVQDIGLARMIRAIAPTQVVHASTQMTVTSAEAIRLTEDLGMKRYVLGREVSIPEMERIRRETHKELEVFVHGALCVSYSGQCLTSESFGGRSANRGQCAQSCRLPYDLIVDGEKLERPGSGYLVSPQDLCGLDDVPRLVSLGIDSFKIEGRLKSPAYVASATRSYKQKSLGALSPSESHDAVSTMARVYSRGFFNGWFDGVNHQRLVNPGISSHHGLALGPVEAVEGKSVVIRSMEPIVPGDGLVFRDPVTGAECGGAVYGADRRDSEHCSSVWRVSFARDTELTQKVRAGMEVYLNASPQVQNELERSFIDKNLLKRIPISLVVQGAVGEPLLVTARDSDGHSVQVRSQVCLVPAERAPLTVESVRAELGSLGGTVFTLDTCEFQLTDLCFIHARELKTLRRNFTDALTKARLTRPTVEVSNCVATDTVASMQTKSDSKADRVSADPLLHLLVREVSQLDALEGLPVDTVYLDFEFGKEYGSAVEKVRTLGCRVGIATTRILKPGELAHLKVIERLKPDRVLVRNLGALEYLRGSDVELVGDFSLNVANSLTAAWFLEKGLHALCPSYDLNGEQLTELLKATDASRFEVTIHHYIPAFHMEHCVFAAFLSNGSSYRDCGRPCEKHRVELRDAKGALHPLKADAECRNTMFNGVPQSALRLLPALRECGVGAFRVEVLFDTPQVVRKKVELYGELLAGRAQSDEALQALGAVERYGVTDGQLYSIRGYTDRKKDFVTLKGLGSTGDPGLRAVGVEKTESGLKTAF
jgi:putative protease